ncbi:cadherin-86C [Nilaparvata lugens]|uniref:cadherin-86C n=1 Tax=Nilaparvata lugens TaxID=108931 RepID=UPI00193D517E|nr:cadherin-86C [Nilaparvata lugens]
MLQELGIFLGLLTLCQSNYPIFDIQTQMRQLLIPADAKIGSLIYRLRATDADRDYPLSFDATDYGSYVVRIESLPCTKKDSQCLANVFLERTLIAGQLYKFRITVRDTKGDTTTIPVAIQVTDATTDTDSVFPHVPGVVMVPEDTVVGTELDFVIVRKNPRLNRPASLELWGPPHFDLTQSSKMDLTRGVIVLTKKLDYEEKTMYSLNIYATDMYVDNDVDARNIAALQVVVVVTDVQDTPPIWDHIEPLTKLPPNVTQGDIIMTVRAVDGDRGSPREIKYGLVAEGNPFTVFFDIDQKKGIMKLVRPLKELISISRSHQPILLTVVAEEEVSDPSQPPALSSTATIALLLSDVANTPPYFHNQNYVCRLDENSLQGTALIFGDPYITEVKDDDMGKFGIFALSLENNNGTFEITPAVAERSANFVIRVRDNSMLDYEQRHTVRFTIVAKEVNPGKPGLSSTANVIVYIEDKNDNEPIFSQQVYHAQVPENATMGMKVVKVEATDMDLGQAGQIKYTHITGYKNYSLNLHPKSGLVTIATDKHGLDREEAPEYTFFIEARDMAGTGNVATCQLVLQILDINDETPTFLRNPNDFILSGDRSNFSQRAFVEAVDKDAEAPNNVVRYEIVSGNYGNSFAINAESGEVTVKALAYNRKRQASESKMSSVIVLMVRAYDLGVPTLWSMAEVRIFPPENGARTITFIVPGLNPDKKALEEMLSALTAGRVSIQSIRPYYVGLPVQGGTQDLAVGYPDTDKSVVVASVMYNGNTIIDLEKLQQKLYRNKTALVVTASAGEHNFENQILFWILLLILILIALMILTLLLCCLCSGCPLYAALSRKRGRNRTPEDGYTKKGHESKGVQAEWTGYKEAWSADDSNRTHFNRRNEQGQRVMIVNKSGQPEYVRLPRDSVVQRHDRGPNVIYTREMADRRAAGEPVFVEDIDGADFRLLDPSRLAMPNRLDDDTDSIRRHEYERGSDGARTERRIRVGHQDDDMEDMPRSRDQMFIRDGNAEILRLMTRGRMHEENGPGLNQPDRPYTVVKDTHQNKENEGKDIIMKRFIEDQQRRENEKNGVKPEERGDSDLIRRLMEYKPDVELSSQDVGRLTVLQRDLLLTRFLVEEQRRFMGHASSVDETQSLPGVMTSMGTQTDRDRGTQTDENELHTLRPPRRRAKSDNDESVSESEENGRVESRKKAVRRQTRCRRALQRKGATRRSDSFDDILRRCEKREIKTPIMEETESAVEATKVVEKPNNKPKFAATKASLLRKQSTRIKLYMLKTAGGRAIDEEQAVPQSTEMYNIIVNKDTTDEESDGKVMIDSKSKSTSDLKITDANTLADVQRNDIQYSSLQSAMYNTGNDPGRYPTSMPATAHGVMFQNQLQQGVMHGASGEMLNVHGAHPSLQTMGNLAAMSNMPFGSQGMQDSQGGTHPSLQTMGNLAAMSNMPFGSQGMQDSQGGTHPSMQTIANIGSMGFSGSGHSDSIQQAGGVHPSMQTMATLSTLSPAGMNVPAGASPMHHPSMQTMAALSTLSPGAMNMPPGSSPVHPSLQTVANMSTMGSMGNVTSQEDVTLHGTHPSLHTLASLGAMGGGRGDMTPQEVAAMGGHPSMHTLGAMGAMGAGAHHLSPQHNPTSFPPSPTIAIDQPSTPEEHVVPSIDPSRLNLSGAESGRETSKSNTSSGSTKSVFGFGAIKGFTRFAKSAKKVRMKSSSESHLPNVGATAQKLDTVKEEAERQKSKSLQSTPVAKKKRGFGKIKTLSRLFATPASAKHKCDNASSNSKEDKSKTSTEKIDSIGKKPEAESKKFTFKKEPLDKSQVTLNKTIMAFQSSANKAGRQPRYMEWYKKRKEEKQLKKEDREKEKSKEKEEKERNKDQTKVNTIRFLKPIGKKDNKKDREEDLDSGIAMSLMMPPSQVLRRRNHNLLEKKSVFTIAYDEMQTQKLSTDQPTPP